MTYMKDPVIKDALTTAYEAAETGGCMDSLKAITDYLTSENPYGVPAGAARKKLEKCESREIMQEIMKSYLGSDAAQPGRTEFKKTLRLVYDAEQEKGYNPYFQISEYLVSGDPSYITASVRDVMRGASREDMLDDILKEYLEM